MLFVDGDGDAETDITTGGNGDRESTVDETADAENSDSDGDHIRHIVISGDGGLRKKKNSWRGGDCTTSLIHLTKNF